VNISTLPPPGARSNFSTTKKKQKKQKKKTKANPEFTKTSLCVTLTMGWEILWITSEIYT